MASAGDTICLPDTERFFMELSTMITRAQQQRNATATRFDSSEFLFADWKNTKELKCFKYENRTIIRTIYASFTYKKFA